MCFVHISVKKKVIVAIQQRPGGSHNRDEVRLLRGTI